MTSAFLGARNAPARLKTITFSLKVVIDKDLGSSDKVILPESAINEIMREFSNPPNPIIFEIHSVIYDKQKPPPPQLHCGVLQFTADAKTARIPYWMTYCLQHHNGERVKDGDRMKFKLVRGLEPAKYAKFRPLDKRFARDIQTPRASLEHALHKFTALTAGQRIPIIHDGRVYPVKVEEVRPSPAAHLIDTNLQVEFVEHDEMKAIDEQHDIRGLIQGHSSEVKTDAIDGDDDDDDDVDLVAYEVALQTTAKRRKIDECKAIQITAEDSTEHMTFDAYRTKYQKMEFVWVRYAGQLVPSLILDCVYDENERFYPEHYRLLWITYIDSEGDREGKTSISEASYKDVTSRITEQQIADFVKNDNMPKAAWNELRQYKPDFYQKYFDGEFRRRRSRNKKGKQKRRASVM
mmetsp:Transcript_35591/g.58310  ORF Transcript_35591/g.58310 Transcript_35591/m.58310 type:complete len:407 (-) Transcript_35591:230-1450(-)